MTKKAPMVEEITDFEVLEIALRELAIEKGLFTPEDHRQYTEFAEAMGPTPASRLVAKAWTDPAFKKRALEDPIAASLEVGINWLNPTGFGTPSDFTALHILEDTPTLHHVVTCTLCSCYPRPILGNSPEWYRTPNYRRRIVRTPRQVLAELVSSSHLRLRFVSKIRTQSTGFSCCPCGRMERRAGAKSSWLQS